MLHVTSAFVLVSALQPITALQPSIYGFIAVYGFIAATCNLVVTFGDAHWAKLIPVSYTHLTLPTNREV